MKRHEGGIESYPEQYLECRGDSHDWKWITDDLIVRNSRRRIIEWSRIRQCPRCKLRAIKKYDVRTGRVMGSRYDYSETEGYLARRASGLSAGHARLERLRRIGIDIGD